MAGNGGYIKFRFKNIFYITVVVMNLNEPVDLLFTADQILADDYYKNVSSYLLA